MAGLVGHVQFKTFNFKKTLWLLLMDEVQLSQGYRATTKRELTF